MDESLDERRSTPASRGGWCLPAVLYGMLGALLALVVALVIGTQWIDGVIKRTVAGAAAPLQTIIVTPTPTIIDRGGMVLQMRALARLETQRYTVERIIEARIERGDVLDLVLGERLLLIASGEAVAGVDLAALRAEDVLVSDDGRSVTIQLPPSQVFSVSLDSERTRVYDRQTGLLARPDRDLERQARLEAEATILAAACEQGMMQRATTDAQRAVEQLLRALAFDEVTVLVTPGACRVVD